MSDSWPYRQDAALEPSFSKLQDALSELPNESLYRESLWEATLAHIAEVPWYAMSPRKELAEFPLLSGKDIADAEETHHLYHPRVERDVIFTSGGSTGRSKLMPHAYMQFSAMSILEEATLGMLCRYDDYSFFNGQPFARVRLLESIHGPRFPWPSGHYVQHVVLASDQASNVPAIRDVLTGSKRNPVRGRTPTELVAAMSKLLAVAFALEETGQNLQDSTVERIFAGGSASSPIRQQWFEKIFGGRFVELYGSTEVWQGNCQRCFACKLFHEPLTVIHEYLPTEFPEAYRELVVTTLVPFALTMPLLRYRTGDLVRLGPYCDTAGKIGFEYVGRINSVRYFPDSGLVLSPLALAKSVPNLMGIHRLTVDKLEREFPLPENLRWPAYHCDAYSSQRVRVRIETMNHALGHADVMRDKLLDELAVIDERIPDHVEIMFVPAKTLESYTFD